MSHPKASPAKLLTRQQVADLFACSHRTVIRMEERGELRAIHIGKLVRFRPEDIEALLTAK